MKKIYAIAVLASFSFLLFFNSCKHEAKHNAEMDPLVSHIDSTVNPADDFFDYANGKWFKENPIPANEQSNGIWQLIQDTINAQIKQICLTAAADANAPKGSNMQKIGDFYASGMDSNLINELGLTGIKDYLNQIDSITGYDDLFKEAAKIQTVSGSPFFGFYIAQDDKNSNQYAATLWQGGLDLPNRDYYFDDDARSKSVRKQFVKYATKLFGLMGYDNTQAEAASVSLMRFETDLAKASRKLADTRDPFANYNKMSIPMFQAFTPSIDWQAFFQQLGLKNVDTVIVGQPEFFTALNGYLQKYSLDNLKDYLKFQLVNSLSSYLDDTVYNAHFHFYSTVLRGVEQPKPRWERVVDATNSYLGELVGQVYVADYLPKGTKEKLLEIGNAVKKQYAVRIQNVDWMSDSTKEKALEKLNAMNMKVGYPDKWKDMSSVAISRNSYVQNVMNVNKWYTNRMISHYGKPVDRTEWQMFPQTYNAYYSTSNNEIVIPGCNIIVPGYERQMADDAVLYAIIGGSTFGHEMTHGFDDQGSKYDKYGNLHNWWTPEDSAKFHAKTRAIVNQFNQYVVIDSMHINGEATQGENIADLGGIVIGYQAFKNTKQYQEGKKIAGYTPSQRFFLGYALAWMVNYRPEALANRVKSDVHSPAKWRVLGPLSNMPEFYDAFGVKKGDAMWKPDSLRVVIW